MSLNINEKYFSHIPAVKTLIALGYKLLNQERLKEERSNSQGILLENILIEQILKFNNNFSEDDAKEAVRKLTNIVDSGLIKTNQKIYDLLTLGTAIKKNFKSYNFKYIDWQNLKNNIYHVTFEMPIDSIINRLRKCDIIVFINGIPFVVIECKSPTESLEQAISQHIRNQKQDQIPHLFHYAQLLIAVNKNEAKYATVGSSKDHWSVWREELEEKQNIDIIRNLINTPLDEEEKENLYTGNFTSCGDYFDKQQAAGTLEPTEQDKILYALCRPERLLDLVKNFCVFDKQEKKIARHHQFFATYATIERINQYNEYEIRKGGIIWHTQGTGKSLTMILIAKFLLEAANIANPRIIIITDRIELDEQIKNAFTNCGLEPKLAFSSQNLIKLIKDSTPIITTVINKFNKTFSEGFQDSSNNIFVLVDESHRTQHGDLADKMRSILPNACYIAFTGTPILKNQKNTMKKFGEPIHIYNIKDALNDNMVVPLIYEGRIIQQHLKDESLLNKNFDIITNKLDKEQKITLKRKFSNLNALSSTEQTIYAKALDISKHYSETFKGTGLKGMLIASSRSNAIRFKEFLDEIGEVNSEVVISSSDNREGYENIESENKITKFLESLNTKYGRNYNNEIIRKFKNNGDPEILIVVSKLLTGFDAPRIAVVYICKSLKEHNLLQAIARSNRLFEEKEKNKEYGYIIDYEGLEGEIKHARQLYESDKLKNFDKEDLENAIFSVEDKISELFPLLQEIKNIFIKVANEEDFEQLEQYLANENTRSNFYFLLNKLKYLMSIFSNSNKLAKFFEKDQLDKLYRELKKFNKLKEIVEKRYKEKTDKKIYTVQIMKLLDEHVVAGDITKTDTVNIFNDELFKNFIERTDIVALKKATQITAEVKNILDDYVYVNPAFFQKFSELINNTIAQHHNKRLSDSDYLNKMEDIRNDLKNYVPSKLSSNKTSREFYKKLFSFLKDQTGQDQHETAVSIALDTYDIIKKKIVVHWVKNIKVINEMKELLDNYFFDVVKEEMKINFNSENLNDIIDSLVDIAKEHEAK